MARRRLAVDIVGDADRLNRSYKEAEDGAERFERTTRTSMDKAERSAEGFGGSMERMRGRFDDWGKDLALGIGLGAGALAAGLFAKGFSDSLDREAGQARLGIQLGLSPEMAKAAGALAGEVYKSGFGESLDDANQAVRFITQNIGNLGDTTRDEFKDMTKGVLVLADTFDQDLNKVTATAGTLIKTGLAKDGMEALDLLTRGLQSPANKADDLLDTFTEYSTQFRELGLTGPQALGLLSQGLQGGARDADTVADALKEFAIRAQDGSATTATAFAQIGLDAQTMAQTIAAGGEPAAAALQLTFDKLNAIEDPALRAQVATGLFGTKAEDLQNALSVMDLSTATTQVGNVEGAMNNATAATDTNKAKVEEWKRGMEENVTNFIADSVQPKLVELWGDWNKTGTFAGDLHNGLVGLGDGFRFIKDEGIDPMVGSLQTLFGWLGDTIEKIEDFVGWVGRGIGGAMNAIGNNNLLGFDTGGVVPGPPGAPQLAVVHGGETILPTHDPSFSLPSVSSMPQVPVAAGGGGGQVINLSVYVEGSVVAKDNLVQEIRSGLIQASRYGQGALA